MVSQNVSFGASASLYDRARPAYPADAVRWLLGDVQGRVVELGAGTGIFTRLVRSLGYDVVGVEPDARMRTQLALEDAELEVLGGSAEEIPLPDGSADAVVAAQAYHWFDPARAHAEIARVLRPGGVLGLVWNIRDDDVPWLAELTQAGSLGAGSKSRRFLNAELELDESFGAVERTEFRNPVRHNAASLAELVRSWSHYLSADDEGKARIDESVSELTSGMPEIFEVPYTTVAYRARRTDG